MSGRCWPSYLDAISLREYDLAISQYNGGEPRKGSAPELPGEELIDPRGTLGPTAGQLPKVRPPLLENDLLIRRSVSRVYPEHSGRRHPRGSQTEAAITSTMTAIPTRELRRGNDTIPQAANSIDRRVREASAHNVSATPICRTPLGCRSCTRKTKLNGCNPGSLRIPKIRRSSVMVKASS